MCGQSRSNSCACSSGAVAELCNYPASDSTVSSLGVLLPCAELGREEKEWKRPGGRKDHFLQRSSIFRASAGAICQCNADLPKALESVLPETTRFPTSTLTPALARSSSADRPAAPDTAPLPFYLLLLPSSEETKSDSLCPGGCAPLALWRSTKLRSGMGELCVGAASMRTREVGSWRSSNGCLIRWPAAVCAWRKCRRSAAAHCWI